MSRILRHPAFLYPVQVIGFGLFMATIISPLILAAIVSKVPA